MSEMNADKNSLKPCDDRATERVEFNEPIELFGVETHISLKRKKRRRNYYPVFLGVCKLISLFLAFAALFYIVFGGKTQNLSDAGDATAPDREAVATPSTTIGGKEEETSDFVFLDESGKGIDINALSTDSYTLAPLIGAEREVRVIIMHSHSSERASENMGVAALGEELCKRLNEAGIGAYHCTDKMDKNGVIGAYDNMRSSLSSLLKSYPKAVLLIDLHDSDVGDGLTLTVGADEGAGWTENLTLALALCRKIRLDGHSLRVLPSAIGQDNGLLSIHLGIGGEKQTEEGAIAALDAFVEAFFEVCKR